MERQACPHPPCETSLESHVQHTVLYLRRGDQGVTPDRANRASKTPVAFHLSVGTNRFRASRSDQLPSSQCLTASTLIMYAAKVHERPLPPSPKKRIYDHRLASPRLGRQSLAPQHHRETGARAVYAQPTVNLMPPSGAALGSKR